jgi:hypothetical protein
MIERVTLGLISPPWKLTLVLGTRSILYDTWALNNRALAYKHLGKTEKARASNQRSGIDPAFEQAKSHLKALAAASGAPAPGTYQE